MPIEVNLICGRPFLRSERRKSSTRETVKKSVTPTIWRSIRSALKSFRWSYSADRDSSGCSGAETIVLFRGKTSAYWVKTRFLSTFLCKKCQRKQKSVINLLHFVTKYFCAKWQLALSFVVYSVYFLLIIILISNQNTINFLS